MMGNLKPDPAWCFYFSWSKPWFPVEILPRPPPTCCRWCASDGARWLRRVRARKRGSGGAAGGHQPHMEGFNSSINISTFVWHKLCWPHCNLTGIMALKKMTIPKWPQVSGPRLILTIQTDGREWKRFRLNHCFCKICSIFLEVAVGDLRDVILHIPNQLMCVKMCLRDI